MFNQEKLLSIRKELEVYKATLVAVSKTKSPELIKEAYENGQRDFGENYVQEIITKQTHLPGDIHWHFIGHLQTNKVKSIVPFISLIHGVDSMKLLTEINKEGEKFNRNIDCLLQIFIAKEESKFGFDFEEANELLNSKEIQKLSNIRVKGLMGMATLTDDVQQIRKEFKSLKLFFDVMKKSVIRNAQFEILSMGMTSDYKIALEEGSNMVRIGSAIFGERV